MDIPGRHVHRFAYLKIGLAAILIWVGVKMALHDIWQVPTTLSLGIIVGTLAVAIVASLVATRGQGRRPLHGPAAPMFREATEEELAEGGRGRRR